MAELYFLNGPRKGQVHELEGDHAVIGRHRSCEVVLPRDKAVSREHAVLQREDNTWKIIDLGSDNLVFVNSLPATDAALKPGDMLLIGHTKLEFRNVVPIADLTDPENPTPNSPVPAGPMIMDMSDEDLGAETLITLDETELDDAEAVAKLKACYDGMCAQLGHVIVGQNEVIRQLLIAIFARGHALLMGVPGLAKTLLVSSLGNVLALSYKRIQFTPDLMPADITGTDVLEEDHATGRRSFRFVDGPVFANLVLADEINRTPPKTQAALLEAMQERHVTVGDQTRPLPNPFFVLATQNPIEQEGTFPLPEAQLDRFLFNILVDYPNEEEEEQIIRQVTSGIKPQLEAVMDAEVVLFLQDLVTRVPVADHVIAYASKLARSTRPKSDDATELVRDQVAWGAGPRAGISMITAAKANAVLDGRYHVTTHDVNAVAHPVLRHRVLPTFSAEAAGTTADSIIDHLIETLQPSFEFDRV